MQNYDQMGFFIVLFNYYENHLDYAKMFKKFRNVFFQKC
jgi:hypothetical protein